MSVLKFGGSSLANAKKVQNAAAYIKKRAQNEPIIVVVSAMGKTTNALVDLAESIRPLGNTCTKAEIITMGENLSAALLCYALEGLNEKAVWLDCLSAGIHSMGDSLNAIITHIDREPISSLLKSGHIVIVTGFQGNNSGHVQALGRGGSDTTAVALSIVFDMPVEIHTDVDGYYDLDPNIYPAAQKNEQMNIYSCIESAMAGAKVLDKRCLCLAEKYKKEITTCQSTKAGGTKIIFSPLEGFNVDCINCKTGFLFVEKTSNLIENIQTNFQNNEILFFQSSLDGTTYFLEKEVENATAADLVVLTGSGLNSPEFSQKLTPKIKDALAFCINPTIVKLVFKHDSKTIFNEIIKAFK